MEGEYVVLMDNTTFEQVHVPSVMLGDGIEFLKEGMEVKVTFEEDDAILSSFQKVTKGISDIVFKDNYYFILNVREIKEAGPKLFAECKGKVMSDYQQFLESNWVNDLKKEFEVKVQPEVFYAIKKQLQQ